MADEEVKQVFVLGKLTGQMDILVQQVSDLRIESRASAVVIQAEVSKHMLDDATAFKSIEERFGTVGSRISWMIGIGVGIMAAFQAIMYFLQKGFKIG